MMDYSLCRHTVTVYRNTDRGISRSVLEGCYLQQTTAADYDQTGRQLKRPFLLVIPGSQDVQVDDLIYAGVGPMVAEETWQAFIPANQPRLMQVQYVTDYGCHIEAGRKNTAYQH